MTTTPAAPDGETSPRVTGATAATSPTGKLRVEIVLADAPAGTRTVQHTHVLPPEYWRALAHWLGFGDGDIRRVLERQNIRTESASMGDAR